MTAEEIIARVRGFEIRKEGWQDIPIERLRVERANELLLSAIGIVRDLCGEELLRASYGECDGSDRAETLKMISHRARLASWLFLPFAEEPGNLTQVVMEARAVAAGAPPDLFAPIPGRISQYRILLCKIEALRWDAYLSGIEEISTAARQAAISSAYDRPWETIRKWREQAVKLGPRHEFDAMLFGERVFGSRARPRRMMRSGEAWEDALARSGQRFSDANRRHAVLAEAERKK